MKKLNRVIVLLSALLFAGSVMAAPVWIPAKLNGKKGDIVFTGGGSGGMISDLLAVFGGYWSHSGLLIDDGESIRHNTMYTDDLPLEEDGCGVPIQIEPDALSNGLPGTITQSVESAYTEVVEGDDPSFSVSGGVIISPTDENEVAYREYLEAVADKMIFLQAYYRVNAYMDMYQMQDIDYLVKGVGNHCSGTIWYANHFTGKTMNVAIMDEAVVDECVLSLYDSVYEMVEEQLGCASTFYPSKAEEIANQVVNTFGFDRSDDLSSYWRGFMGEMTAEANAPDHLLLNSYLNPSGDYSGIQTEDTSYYGKVTPVEYSDGYYTEE